MARRLDPDERRVYRSFSGEKPRRTIAVAWNPYRYQSKWVSLLREHLRATGSARTAEPGGKPRRASSRNV